MDNARTSDRTMALGASLGFLAVALGAFGAHALKPALVAMGTRDVWDTAVFYHAAHAVLLTALGASGRGGRWPVWCFVAGTAVFSGSLYALAGSGARWLGAVTPVGGVLLLVGWGLLAAEGFRRASR